MFWYWPDSTIIQANKPGISSTAFDFRKIHAYPNAWQSKFYVISSFGFNDYSYPFVYNVLQVEWGQNDSFEEIGVVELECLCEVHQTSLF